MKILFAGGGTAGHINPAISVANYIKEQEKDFEALFVGTERGLERKLVPASGYSIKYIDVSGFNRKNMLKNISVIIKLQKARRDAVKILRDFKPDWVICTGGYVSGPVILAAKKLGIPSIIHEQNVYPGLTVKGSQRYADYIAVSFSETIEHLKDKKKCVVTGNPVRPEILKAEKDTAREGMGLSEKPFILVFGGSLGAGRINETMLEMFGKIQDGEMDILFGTGDRNYAEITERIKNEDIKIPDGVKIVPYINNMSEAMAAADIVISRAGAITVSEIAALKKPSILIPSPNVVRNHQEQNARAIEKAGGAEVITEAELTSDMLFKKLKSLIGDEARRDHMSRNLKKIAKTNALEKIYQLMLDMAE
ncbi:MAG: undecaprenyldiphospho-muramoylpentapeptide beta-N-acetylglucosaminyltransferase, partial [Clostridia bacterium]|nr:undecaprenyldiphospho-muramoylpentapeptide beta-N-acetylglucosaminyltransferase [Clostridia bacterium]